MCEGCFDWMRDLSRLESVRGFEVEALVGRFVLSLRDRRSLLLLSFDEPWEEEDGGRKQEEVIHDGTLSRWPPSRHVGASTLLEFWGDRASLSKGALTTAAVLPERAMTRVELMLLMVVIVRTMKRVSLLAGEKILI
jgi:hypothetical protein